MEAGTPFCCEKCVHGLFCVDHNNKIEQTTSEEMTNKKAVDFDGRCLKGMTTGDTHTHFGFF